MDNTGQGSSPQFDDGMQEIDLQEYIYLLWKKKWLVISLVLIAVVVSYFYSNSLTRIYETTTVVMVREDNGMDSLFADQFSPFSSSSRISTYTALFKTRPILNRVVEELDLRNEEGELISTRSLGNMINISGSSDTNLITIRVEYKEAEMARDIANKLVEVFQDENQKLNRSDLGSASSFITSQLATVQSNLLDLEERTLNFKMEEGIILPQEFARNVMNQLTTLETNRAEAQLRLEETELALAETREYFSREDRELVSSKTLSNNPIVSTNRQRLLELEVELAALLEVYTERHPQVIELQSKKAEIENILAGTVEEIISSRTETLNPLHQELRQRLIALETELITSKARIDGLDRAILEIERDLNQLPEKELELARLEREARVAENLYIILMERREEIQIQEAMQSSDIIVVDPAIVNGNPIRPRTQLNIVIAAFLAGFVAVFIIFMIEYFDNTVKEEKDVEQLTGLPVLGVIPDIYLVDHDQGYGRTDYNA
ncbi:GumC family protein [Natronospora cellulosivora (SeqCode)]